MLKHKGYNTACIGKWHLGFLWPWRDGVVPSKKDRNNYLKNNMFDWSKPILGGPLAIGFDHYFGDDVPNFPPYAFIKDSALTCNPVNIDPNKFQSIGKRGHFHGAGPGQEDWRIENVMPTITQKAVSYIADMSKKEKPFFLYFATTSPHTPVAPLPGFQGKSEAGNYGDYVVQTDDAIGKIVKALKDNNCFDNTLLIVTSDNGPSPQIDNVIRDYKHLPASGFRGMKFDTWEGGHRIPFVVSWPMGKINGGRKSNALISLVDIFGTIANIIGYALPDDCAEDSYNALASLKELKPVRDELVYQNSNGNLGLRDGERVFLEGSGSGARKEPDWLVDLFKIQSPDSTIQLFNLGTDLGQKMNIQDKYPEKTIELTNRLSEIKNGMRTR